jgi:hypothetical protein
LALTLAAGCGGAWAQGMLGGCQVFPTNNIWNRRIDTLPADPNTVTYLRLPAPKPVIVDPVVPINIVPADRPMQALTKIEYADESDAGPFPIPEAPQVEPGNDAHMLIVQQGSCRLFELYAAKQVGGKWSALSTAIFDLNGNRLRPDGWTSTDAAGLPMAAGLLRYDEVRAGAIRHALRMTMPRTQRGYVWPARHFASRQPGRELPPMGLRIRLKASYDLSRFSPETRVVLTALKQYGAFVADNGGAFMFTATPDAWPQKLIDELHTVTSEAFEAVDESELMMSQNSGAAAAPSSTGEVKLEFAPALSLELGQGSVYSVTLTGNAKLAAVSGATPGQVLILRVCQDAAGGHAFLWPATVHGAMKVGAAPGKCSVQQFAATSGGLYASGPGVLDQ